MLHAAKRHHVAHRAISIDPHRTSFECRRHPHGATDVACPDACSQTINRIVGHLNSMRLILKTHDGQHGAKHFFASDTHVGINIYKNRWLNKLTTGQSTVSGWATAQDTTRPLSLSNLDVIQNFFILTWRSHRANIGIGQHRVAFTS